MLAVDLIPSSIAYLLLVMSFCPQYEESITIFHPKEVDLSPHKYLHANLVAPPCNQPHLIPGSLDVNLQHGSLPADVDRMYRDYFSACVVEMSAWLLNSVRTKGEMVTNPS